MPARVGRAQVAAVATLVALPLLVYGLPAVLGHPVVPGDDLTQSLPLREVVGRDLRSGHLPIFDPYIWGGAPLLAGWNAGAAYPLTWLFAVLPGAAAWTVNLAAAALAAGLGCYAFARASGLCVLASWAGAVTYAFGGAMAAQVPHIGLVIGMSWVPVALLAVLHLTDGAAAGRPSMWWSAVLAGAVALVVLAGEPRAVTDGAAVLLLYVAWRLLRLLRLGLGLGRRTGRSPHGATRTLEAPPVGHGAWWRGSLVIAAALLVGAGLGAVQLVPGLAAVATSQRAQVTAELFGAGSLPVRWLTLLGVPDLLGGSGSFGQPTFLGSYNLTEVTGYVGLLPLAGAAGLLATLRRSRPVPEWVVWEVVAAGGLLLALGNHTPLWHVLIRVPLVGGQRLQSRGILVTDLALAVLLAYWLDTWARRPKRGGPRVLAMASARWRAQAARWLGALPLVGVVVLVAVALVAEPSFLEWMGATTSAATRATGLRPWLVPSLLLALGALALLVWGQRLSSLLRGALAATFVVVDLLTFVVTTVVAVGAPGASTGTVATASASSGAARLTAATVSARVRPISALHLRGRFAVYDPGLLYPSQLATLGAPDANAVDGTWSVQGYGSIVDAHYAAATGVHDVSGGGQDVFSPAAAADGTFDSLATSTVLAPSQYLAVPAGAATADPTQATRQANAGAGASWFLGSPMAVRSARVEVRATPAAGTAPVGSRPRIGLLTGSGSVEWARVRAGGTVTVAGAAFSTWDAVWHATVAGIAIVVDPHVRAVVAAPVVVGTNGRSLALDGALQDAIVAPHWRYGGQDGEFALFENRRAHAPLSLRALPGGSLSGAAVRRLSGPALEPRTALVSSPEGVDVVRAVTAIPGWTASWAPLSGDRRPTGARTLVVRRLGVVQVVRVPAGRGILTWTYVAPGLLVGEVVSAVALALAVALVAVLGITGWRRRSRWS